jgi:hypothetical protein
MHQQTIQQQTHQVQQHQVHLAQQAQQQAQQAQQQKIQHQLHLAQQHAQQQAQQQAQQAQQNQIQIQQQLQQQQLQLQQQQQQRIAQQQAQQLSQQIVHQLSQQQQSNNQQEEVIDTNEPINYSRALEFLQEENKIIDQDLVKKALDELGVVEAEDLSGLDNHHLLKLGELVKIAQRKKFLSIFNLNFITPISSSPGIFAGCLDAPSTPLSTSSSGESTPERDDNEKIIDSPPDKVLRV